MQSILHNRDGNPGAAQEFAHSRAGGLFLVLGASIFVALCAHVSVPLWFTPVPVTLQTLAVVLVGLLLGPSLGCRALILYLLEGAIGLPVFSPHGAGGLAQLLGPTGGYLLAFPFAAATAGFLVQRMHPIRSRVLSASLASTIATALILACGAVWLLHLLHLSSASAWRMAVLPFLPGESVKVAAAALAFASIKPLRQV